jgi:extradiol dioxygenase family protein
MRPFHLAFPVADLEVTKRFYVEVLGCGLGRESAGEWVDFDLFGHQVVAHHRAGYQGAPQGSWVDGDDVPVPHFGVVLTMDAWKTLAARLEAEPTIRWGVRPRIRFAGQVGEQATLFIFDPSGNALEFKGFAHDDNLFAT